MFVSRGDTNGKRTLGFLRGRRVSGQCVRSFYVRIKKNFSTEISHGVIYLYRCKTRSADDIKQHRVFSSFTDCFRLIKSISIFPSSHRIGFYRHFVSNYLFSINSNIILLKDFKQVIHD